jgi:hypothetical protein
MYKLRKLFGYEKHLDKYPLYIVKGKKTFREIVNKKTVKLLKKHISKIISNKQNKDFFKIFKKEFIFLYLAHYFRSKIYSKVSKNEILKHLNKKDHYSKLFNFDFVDLIYVIKIQLKLINFFLIKFFKRTNFLNFGKCDILVEYLNGDNSTKKDFPYKEELLKINRHIKIKYLFSSHLSSNGKNGLNKFRENYISRVRNTELKYKPFYVSKISHESKKAIFFCFKNFFKSPLKFSIYLEFIINYEYYYQIFKNLNVKLYINSTWDQNIPAIRQALLKQNGKNIAFQYSYPGNKEDMFLDHANDIIFAWGKDSEKNLDKKSNFIEKIIKINPTHLQYQHKVKKKKQKIITIFDSSFNKDGYISPEIYNKFLKLIIESVLLNKNLKLCMKHKYTSFEKYIDSSNQVLIKKLKFNKRYKSFHGSKIENSRLIVNSDLVLSINSLSISAEALLNDTDSLNLCNSSIDKNFLKKINNLHPFAYYDLNEFKKNFYKKLNFKNQNYKIKKLKNFFFENNIKKIDPVSYINNLLYKDSSTAN